ncbi:MAG TPA: putative porin [Bacteroidia bacterium]|jgi:hypothetical protein
MRIFISIVISFLLFELPLFADNDTTKKTEQTASSLTRYFTENQFEWNDSTSGIDNSLYEFHKYIPKNTLGNNGLPFSPMIYNSEAKIGFNYYKNHYRSYFYTPERLHFYNTRTPYTDLLYIIGTKREQMFKMTFSYNVKKNFNITADFFRIRSEGIYLRQNTNDNGLALSGNYKSLNNRYWAIASITYNSFKNAENGGIANDSIFEEGGSIDKKLLDIHLSSARKSVGNGNVFLKQMLNFGKRSNDTLNKVIPGSRLILTSTVDANYFKYEDDNPTSGYYSDVYLDTTKTFDSTFYYVADNELQWKRLDNLKHSGIIDMIGFGASLKHQFIKINQNKNDTSFNNVIGGAEIYNTYSNNSLWWNLSGKYVVTGYNKNDYRGTLVIKKNIGDSLTILGFKAESRLQQPDLIYNFYRSNHFRWTNEFEQTLVNSVDIYFEMKKYKLMTGASYSIHSNILYFDNYAIAREYKGAIPVLRAFIKKDFSVLNWHLNNNIVYQHVEDSTVIRIPELILEHSLYYENDFLKKALLLQIGASVYYTSSYYANGYMPATGQFYLQDSRKFGAYPFVDFFINAQVKTVRVFFKIDHLNAGWSGNTYILTPGYPYPDRTFKFGISWKFYD